VRPAGVQSLRHNIFPRPENTTSTSPTVFTFNLSLVIFNSHFSLQCGTNVHHQSKICANIKVWREASWRPCSDTPFKNPSFNFSLSTFNRLMANIASTAAIDFAIAIAIFATKFLHSRENAKSAAATAAATETHRNLLTLIHHSHVICDTNLCHSRETATNATVTDSISATTNKKGRSPSFIPLNLLPLCSWRLNSNGDVCLLRVTYSVAV